MLLEEGGRLAGWVDRMVGSRVGVPIDMGVKIMSKGLLGGKI